MLDTVDAQLLNATTEMYGGKEYLVGDIYEDQKGRWPNGTRIRTSPIVGRFGDIVCTKNTTYELIEKEPDMREEDYDLMPYAEPYDPPPYTYAPEEVPRKTPNGPQAYKGNGKHDWELVIEGNVADRPTYRLRVPGGWLYRYAYGDPVFVPVPEVVGYKI